MNIDFKDDPSKICGLKQRGEDVTEVRARQGQEIQLSLICGQQSSKPTIKCYAGEEKTLIEGKIDIKGPIITISDKVSEEMDANSHCDVEG